MKDTPAFVPAFSYTHEMVRRLAAIAAAREVIRAAHASTAIEGNPLSLDEVSRLADGREIMAARRAKAEVLNYLRVLEHISTYQKNQAVSDNHILALHRDITRDTLDDPAMEGAFRTVRVVVGNRRTKEVVYSAPSPGEVRPQVERLVAWLNSEDARRMHPAAVASLVRSAEFCPDCSSRLCC